MGNQGDTTADKACEACRGTGWKGLATTGTAQDVCGVCLAHGVCPVCGGATTLEDHGWYDVSVCPCGYRDDGVCDPVLPGSER